LTSKPDVAELIRLGCFADAVDAQREVVGRDRFVRDPWAWNLLGVACKYAGQFDEAEAAYERARTLNGGLVDKDLEAVILHNLGGLAHSRRRPREAEEFARAGLALRRQLRSDPTALASDLAALASILETREQWVAAEALYREALAIWSAVDDDYEVGMTLNGLAAVVRFSGRPAEAEPLFVEAIAKLEEAVGPTHPDTATARNNLAMLLNASGRAQEAIALLARASADLRAVLGEDHPATKDVAGNLASVRAGQNG
jgi:tetratricopeptide (TPR) repeat protein